METQDILAQNLRLAREQAGLSQARLARALGLASHSAVSEMEAGQRRLSATELAHLSEVLGKRIDWFFSADSGREDFVALARAQDAKRPVKEALADAERYFAHYLLLRRLLSKKST